MCTSWRPTSNRPAGCPSSSSDEAEVVDTDGWLSVVSVLDTPDRRRMRKSLRQDRPAAPILCAHGNGGHSLLSPPAGRAFKKLSPATVPFCSPPVLKRKRPDISSPTLRTPRQTLVGIHLSGSPLRSFFVLRHRTPRESLSPKSRCLSLPESPILKPSNIQNYIGIRFSGEQPAEMTRAHLLDPMKNIDEDWEAERRLLIRDENCGKIRSETTNGSSSRRSHHRDSGFFDSSSSLVETPSKGLAITQCSTPYSLVSVPIFRPFNTKTAAATSVKCLRQTSAGVLPSPAVQQSGGLDSSILFLDLNNQSSSSSLGPSSFGSPNALVPEQSYGPLEASVLDGILNDLNMWPSSSQSPLKKTHSSLTNRSHNHSILFERRLETLKNRCEMAAGSSRTAPIRWSAVVIEMNEEGSWASDEEMSLLFPELELRQWALMGESADQLEVTRQAKIFLRTMCQGKQQQGRAWHSFSAGLPIQLNEEQIISL